MALSRETVEIFIPDEMPAPQAFARITHLGIGAHQDDLEFMAFHGIIECFQKHDQWFGGVTCTDGAGSSRTGVYAKFTNKEMIAVRQKEQNTAARIGDFGAMFQLNHSSAVVKDAADHQLRNDLLEILQLTQPEIVYTHNLADKHDTHIGVTIAALQAMRELPKVSQPKKIIGCEVWRNLDWLEDSEKIVMNVSGRDHLAAALNGVFDSQIAGGKRYDLAIQGRRAANATFFDSHSSDDTTQIIYGMDLTPLIHEPTQDIADFACSFIQRFETDVRNKIKAQLRK